MNLFELQQRANKIVENVNNYEASLTGSSANEKDLLDQHKYVDLFSLRPVFKRLFADTTENRLSTTLLNDTNINLISSFAPAPNITFNYNTNEINIDVLEQQISFDISSLINLTSNGTLGGNTFAASAKSTEGSYSAYKAFTNNITDYYGPSSASVPQWLKFYSPYPINLSSVTFNYMPYSGGGYDEAYKEVTIEGSNDDSSYVVIGSYSDTQADSVTVTIETTKTYKYFRFNFIEHSSRPNSSKGYGKVHITLGGSIIYNISNVPTEIPLDLFATYVDMSSSEIQGYFTPSDNKYIRLNLNSILDKIKDGSMSCELQIQCKPTSFENSKLFGDSQGDYSSVLAGNISATTAQAIILDDTNVGNLEDISLSLNSDILYSIKLDNSGKTSDNFFLNVSQGDNTYSKSGYKNYDVDAFTLPSLQIGSPTNNLTGTYFKGQIYTPGCKVLVTSTYIPEYDAPDYCYNIDLYNSSNMLAIEAETNKYIDRETRIKNGINYSYSTTIYDALVTESQLANVFRWNTSNPEDVPQNSIIFSRQVPGIVMYYLGSGYDGIYTATIPHSIGQQYLQRVNYNTPAIYGSYYRNKEYTQSQVGEEMGAEACKIFIPSSTYFSGRLINPQQIYQPIRKIGEANIDKGYNYQGKAVYHELVFKQRRSGCKDANLDFQFDTTSTTTDNDPQGLATRLVLAKQKQYYYQRPWFDELDELTDKDTSILADNIINNSKVDVPGGLTYTKELKAQVDTANNIFYNNKKSSTTTENGYIAIPIEFPENVDSFIIKCKFNKNRNLTNLVANTYISLGINKQGTFQTDSSIPNGQNCLYTQIESGNSTQIRVYEKNNNNTKTQQTSTGQAGLLGNNVDNTFKIEYVRSTKTLTLYKDINNTGVFSEVKKLTLESELKLDYVKYLFIGCNYNAVLANAITSYQQFQLSCYLDTLEFYINGKRIQPVQGTTRNMTDEEFYSSYHLDYETWADSINKEL